MFGVSTSNQSEELLEEFRTIQEEIFNSFDLYLQVLDMPPHELGAPAYRKSVKNQTPFLFYIVGL